MSSLRLRALPVGFVARWLPTRAPRPPSGAIWLHEIKWDETCRSRVAPFLHRTLDLVPVDDLARRDCANNLGAERKQAKCLLGLKPLIGIDEQKMRGGGRSRNIATRVLRALVSNAWPDTCTNSNPIPRLSAARCKASTDTRYLTVTSPL
jgi:hypothetical protein